MSYDELQSLLAALPALERMATLAAIRNTIVPIVARDLLALCEAVRTLGEERGLA